MIFYDCPNMLFLDTVDPAAKFAACQGSLSKWIIPAGVLFWAAPSDPLTNANQHGLCQKGVGRLSPSKS